jgi:two-component system phosphate regulon sensor histidine kinase PhoR
MKKKIFWKFFLAISAMSLFLAAAFTVLTLRQARSLSLGMHQEQLRRLAGVFRSEIAAAWPGLNAGSLERFVREKGRQSATRLTVIDPQGKVLADSERDPRLMQNHADRPEIAAALSGHERSDTRFSFTLRENMMYFALPLQIAGKTVAALRVSMFYRDIEREFHPWRWRISATLLALLGLSVLFSLLLSRNLSRPIRELAAAARRVSSGAHDVHVRSQRRDEIGDLAADFNAMVDSQRTLVEKLRHSQQELETILATTSDGLLVIDSKDRIVRAGPRFSQLIGDPAPVGKPYWEFLRRSEFADLVRSAGERSIHGEMEINDRVYLAFLSPLPENAGTVVTFHDLTETRRLELQKKDFVANVSHELRTPLTAIKGYAETLAEEISGDGRNYLAVILRHTDRLIEMTNDLLTLSEIEGKGVTLNREGIRWPEMLSDLRILFEKKLREKDLVLDVSLPQNLEGIAFQGDRFRLEQMFINLLDNAVRYTEKGGISIRIAADGAFLLIEIKDSGPGIAVEHLPRIFERFYVVDKARSRQSGGTGLGLAIVKHIVGLHGGEIGVQSVPGLGSTFTIRLPIQTP